MDKQEIIDDMEQFLNDTGNWQRFVKWLEDRGSTPEEYGFSSED